MAAQPRGMGPAEPQEQLQVGIVSPQVTLGQEFEQS